MSEFPSISSDVMEENIKLRQQVREFKDENKNLRKTIELLLKEYGFSKNKKKRELQLQNEKLCLENSELNCCVANLQCEKQALRQQVQAKEGVYEQNDQEWKSAVEQLRNNLKLSCKHEECEMEKLALQEKVENLQTDNQALRSENDVTIQKVQELTKKLADCQKEVRQNEQALQEEMQELDKGEPHQSSFELTPESNESTEKEERIKTSKTTDLEEKNKDIPTESSSHVETPQEQTVQPRDVEDHGGWTTWLLGAALYLANPGYIYPHF